MSTKMGDKLYTFPAETSVVIEGPITLNGEVTYSDPPPGVSLDDLVSLTGTGTFQAADLVATDDLTVGDDATITGTLTVGAGAATVQGADLIANGSRYRVARWRRPYR